MMKMHRLWLFLCSFFMLFSYAGSLLANPEGAQIEAGSAIISAQQKGERLDQELTITQNSDKAIINWDKFSIQEGETTEFVLPSSRSSTLNRVTGGSLSEIYGTLKSNGDLLLINPQGVMIGPNGLVDVGGFLASTYNLKNEDFLKDESLIFFDEHNSSDSLRNPSIINQGQIIARSGDIILLAQDIDNQGLIQSPQGETYLKAGCEVTLLPNEENKVKVRLKRKGSVRNRGTIKAIKAELEACGGIPECLAVSNEGVIEALGIGEKDGKLVLLSDETISVSGTLIAKNEFSNTSETKGGTIHLLGDKVRLEEGSFINASGDLGGGEVLIGGDYQGKNPEIKNASLVYMDKEAVIHADALENGDGGKVILWSEKGTDWRGLATAKGGSESGDGGLVEVSSHGFFNPDGHVDTLAVNGKAGTFLLDPYDITINLAGPDANITGSPNFYPNGTPAVLKTSTITGALAGSNVVISTSGGGGAEDGDITISSKIEDASGNDLTFNADHDINANSNVTITGNLTFNFNQASNNGTITFGLLAGVDYDISSANTVVNGNAANTSAMTFIDQNVAQTVTITAAGAGTVSGTVNVDSFTNIQSITAYGHATDTIIGPAGGQVYNIQDTGIQGELVGYLDSFTNFYRITGGSGNDRFVFVNAGVFTGIKTITIDGGAGNNVIRASDRPPSGSGGYPHVECNITGADAGQVQIHDITSGVGYGVNANYTNVGGFEGSSTARTFINKFDGGTMSGKVIGRTPLFSNPSDLGATGYTKLNWADDGGPTTLNLVTGAGTGIYGGKAGGISGIQYFDGHYGGGEFDSDPENRIYLPNEAITYTMGMQTLYVYGSIYYETEFFAKMFAGNKNDTFVFNLDTFSSDMNFLDGGGGINALDFRSLNTLPVHYFSDGSGYIIVTYPNGVEDRLNFVNMNYLYLPGITYTWINSVIDIVTMPESSIIANAEDKGISLGQKSVLPTAADIRFIINNSLTPGEIGGTAIPLTFNSPTERTSQNLASFIGEKYFTAKNLDPLFKAKLAKLKDTELELIAKNCQFAPLPEVRL